MKIGQTVYTVNAKANKVDEWQYNGTLKTPDALLVYLTNGNRYCFLPASYVFKSKEKASAVAKM